MAVGLSHKFRLLVQESSIHPVGTHYAQNERMAGMVAAAAKVAQSRSHDATPTELSFSFAELLSIRSTIPPKLKGNPLQCAAAVSMSECAVPVGKNRGHRHCEGASLTRLPA